jgi:hypothetical protein
MPRPKKQVDMAKLAELRGLGLSTRNIAKQMGESQSTIWRVIQNPVIQNPDSIQNHPTSKNGKSCKSPASSNLNLPKEHPPLPQLDSHHSAYSFAYQGKQPVSSDKVAAKNNIFYRFDYVGTKKILAHKGRIVVWMENCAGGSVDEIERLNMEKVKRIIAGFAFERKIAPIWPSLRKVAEEHLILQDKALNDLLLAIIRENPEEALKMGIKAGDTSHPDTPEFVPEGGKDSVRTLLEILKDWKNAKDTTFGLVQFGKDTKTILEIVNTRMERVEANQERITQIMENMAFILETAGFAEDQKPKRRMET